MISSTLITVSAPIVTATETSVFDISGKLVATIQEAVLEVGGNTISWNGTDKSGNTLPAGVYVIQTQSQNQTTSEKLVVLR